MAARDRQLLKFAARHPFIRADHAKVLLGDSQPLAEQRLGDLSRAGLLTRQPSFHQHPDSYQITQRGLDQIGSPLPVPRAETIRSYRHEYGVVWLAMAAAAGVYGTTEQILTAREMRARDAGTEPRQPTDHVFETADDHRHPPYGTPLDAGEPPLRLYPDLMLIVEQARIAVRLQLHQPGRRQLERTLTAYHADPHIAAVLYLVTDRAVGEIVERAATNLGHADATHVQPVQFDKHAPAELAT